MLLINIIKVKPEEKAKDTMRLKRHLLRISILFVFSLNLAGCGADSTLFPATAEAAATPAQIPIGKTQAASQPVQIPESMRFTRIGLDEGISQSTVNTIVQDSLGFMWFGTQDGLNRYDGYEFKIFEPDENDPASLSDRYITALAAGEDGDLWVGTRQGGLNYYDSTTGEFEHFRHDDLLPKSIVSDQILTIHIDESGRVWVGTFAGLDLYSPDDKSFTHYFVNTSTDADATANHVNEVVDAGNGDLWLGSEYEGLFLFKPSSGKMTRYLNDPDDNSSISSNTVNGIQVAGDGTVWIATDGGLNHFHPATGRFDHYVNSASDTRSISTNHVVVVFVDGVDNLWVGTDLGIDRYDPVNDSFVHYRNDPGNAESLSANIVESIYESRDGVIWVGTFGGSLSKYDRAMDHFRNFRHDENNSSSLTGDLVFKIFIDQEQYAWIATVGGGINRLDPQTGEVLSFVHDEQDPGSLINDEVWAVYKDSYGVLWVGTSAGLDRLNPGEDQFIHLGMDKKGTSATVPSLVYDMVEDSSGTMWFGTGRGLSSYDRQTDTFTHFAHDAKNKDSISSSSVTKVYLDNSGRLWLGTYSNGMDRYDSRLGKFIHYRNNPSSDTSLSSNTVLSILMDSSGRLWAGTENGLNLLDPVDNTFTHFNEADGLVNNVVYGILEDGKGNLWLSTNKGISCFDPDNGTFINYTGADGLQGNEFDMNAYAKDRDGNLYFGGIEGLSIFDPAKLEKSSYVPPIVLLSITQNGESLTREVTPEQVQEVTVAWPYKGFEFEFASLSYSDPPKNQYAYYLEGFDTDWVDAGTWREGRYTNLPGGTYTLHIKGTNRDGLWNEDGRSLTVVIVPAFWQTRWFQIICALAIVFLALTFYFARTKAIEANNRELERQVELRTKEIERLFEKTKELAVIEERNRLARELHDSAKQKAFAALAQLGTAGGILTANPGAARTHLLEAENLVYEVIEELTFLIQEMYPLALKEKGLITSLREYVFDWEARSGILVKMDVEGERRVHLDIEQAFYRGVQEALSNVARHSCAKEVAISVVYDTRLMTAVVKDNGCGFDQKSRQAGMGLRIIRERIEALEGTVVIESAPDKGTKITLTVPLRSHRTKKGDEND